VLSSVRLFLRPAQHRGNRIAPLERRARRVPYPDQSNLSQTMDLHIDGARILLDAGLENAPASVSVSDGMISDIGADRTAGRKLDARGLLLLPGIVDIHGDAFERQIMPRPGVDISLDIGLVDSDRQAVANGITTVFHGVTWSWEPGLRGADNARAILAAIEELQPRLAADTKFHLRHETYNFVAEPEVRDWIAGRRIGAVAFNDHLPSPGTVAARPDKLAQMVARSGLPHEDFCALVERLRGRGDEVADSIGRIAKDAGAQGVALLSHDDASPEQRRWFRALGCRVSEFPMTIETARDAAAAGDQIVLGAPNVMRGKSHLGWINASDMIAQGLCSVLASDYYYPAPLIAAFRLAANGIVPLGAAWQLVSKAPARAVGLDDRGCIERGQRADLIVVDAAAATRPRIVAVMVGGRIVHLVEPDRLGP
jgi:alpha-D-ribose 1-methylphosphonate 5-triphosphate diphosphatase